LENPIKFDNMCDAKEVSVPRILTDSDESGNFIVDF
jgi:hypothetical protein